MSVTREAIHAALETRLKTQLATATPAGPFVTVSRKALPARDIPVATLPAIFISQLATRSVQSRRSPELRTLAVDLYIYTGIAQNQTGAVPSTIFNPLLDAIDTALAPDPVTMTQSLGGLVEHCWAEGEQPVFEGTTQSQAIIMVPVNILWGRDNIGDSEQFFFDSGALYAVPSTAHAGGTITDLTPIRIGNLKGVTLKPEFEVNPMFSSYNYPIGASVKGSRLRGSAKIGVINGKLLTRCILGENPTVPGGTFLSPDTPGTIPSATAYTLAPAAAAAAGKYVMPTGGTWSVDMGVVYAASGTPLTYTTGTPSAGEYSVSAGTYTFNVAQKGLAVYISFLYTTASGMHLDMSNTYRHVAPFFKLVLHGGYNGGKVTWILNRVFAAQLTVPTALESFTVSELSFEAIDGPAGIGTVSAG